MQAGRALFERFLKRAFTCGELTVDYADGRRTIFGAPAPGFGKVGIRFNDPAAPGFIARHPRIGVAEAFMDGRMDVVDGDIRDLVRLARANNPFETRGEDTLDDAAPVKLVRSAISALPTINTPGRARRNVAHHYDLDDRLYDLFLDRDRQYSCAYFTDPANDLDRAQQDKLAHIAAKLALEPGQRVLDIGCGWGGMALYLNRVANVDVTGITLSEEQLGVARRRAKQAGVANSVRFELCDFREMRGRFDRIVSVGMFEHVGTAHYDAFFAAVKRLMKDDGVMLLHTIGRLGGPGKTDSFTRKYIFPGGYCPALSEIVTASEPHKLIVADCETLRLHYAHTIGRWYDRCVAAREKLVELYDERFYRMWTFYLAGAETVFEYGSMANYQLQYIKNRRALPITRDYMAETEARYRAIE